MNQATFGVAIVAKDQTEKGSASAEKRMGRIPRAVCKSTGSALRTLGSVEAAAAKALGGKSITTGITTRLSAVREAGAAAGEGLGRAATAGSALEGALGAIGVAAGATIGVLAAAGYAAFKLVDGWSKGAAAIGRTADTIGVATRELQQFQAAGERAGVDKGASTGALGSIAQTLNDAKYGRNSGVLQLMGKLGLKFKYGKNGEIDTQAMTLDIADAIARQHNAQARRRIAGFYGISDAALPMFLQGSGQIRADMDDADKHAAVIDDAGIAKGRRIARKSAIVGQMKDRALSAAGEAAAGVTEGGYDGVIKAGRYVMDGSTSFSRSVHNDFAPGARTIGRAADKMDRAADRMSGVRGAGRFSSSQIASLARRAEPLKREGMRYGFTEAEAAGIGANIILESGGRTNARERGGSGRGLIQLTDRARKRLFRKVMGVDIENASRDQQWRYIRWETQHSEAANWRRALASGQDPGAIAAGYARYVERPADKDRDSAERSAVADAIPVHVTVEMRGAPPGTRTSVKAGHHAAPPAVSRAFVYEPVHGG